MRFIGSAEEMQEIDAYSINHIGIPGIVLMERAALSMEEEIIRRFPSPVTVTIVAERGNNGGDGLALGRMLLSKGYPVKFYEIGGVKKASESYQIQKNILQNMGVEFCTDFPKEDSDVWIDAVFGVGLKREITGIQKEILQKMNEKKGYKIAVDIPSGVDASTGQILGYGFRADLTITFGLTKIGLTLYPGADYGGEIAVKDIGFPEEAIAEVNPKTLAYTKEDLALLPKRYAWSNKGSYGKVLLIAGTKNMAGAAYLSAAAAYKAGSGLVRIFTCEENRQILQTLLPGAILTTYQSEEEAMKQLPEAISWATVTGIGPGLGQSSLAKAMLRTVLLQGHTPLVIDADALNCLAAMKKEEPEKMKEYYEGYEHAVILTPHLKEMSGLTGETVADLQKHLPEAAKKAAGKKHIVVLKDARTIVSDGSFPTYINMSGNHGMAAGGSGDVLTGVICGLLAGGLDALTAARLGVYCHGLAGDAAAEEKGYYGLTAENIIEYLPKIIR